MRKMVFALITMMAMVAGFDPSSKSTSASGGSSAIKPISKSSVYEAARNWREQDGVIYLSVTSDGTTGPKWIERLEGKGFCLSDQAKSVLRSPDFQPTSGVTTEVAVLKGQLFEDNHRTTKKIRAEADRRQLKQPNAEVACLIRENFSDEEMEAMGLLYIVTMHEPIKNSVGADLLLGAYRDEDRPRYCGPWLEAYYGVLGRRWHFWHREGGFAFVVSPT